MRKYSTIDNGDCLFAAFVMAYKHRHWPASVQKRLAATVREQVAEHIAAANGYVMSAPLEKADVRRILRMKNSLISKDDIANAATNHGNVNKWKRAYSRIIGTPGVWGGGLELSVLSDLFEVQIVIFSGDDVITIGEIHADNGTVYLLYEGRSHYSAMF
jgi:hypothetical protein